MAALAMKQPDINSIVGKMVDRGPWQYYDTVTCAAGTSMLQSYSLFSIPIGGVDPITAAQKTRLQTNMRKSNCFSPPECLIMYSLNLYFSGDILLSDLYQILKAYYLIFKIDNKEYWQGLLWQFSAGFGVYGSTAVSGQSVWGLGLPSPTFTRRSKDFAKYIAPNMLFTLELITPNATPPVLGATSDGGTGMTLVPFLDGLTDRSVQ